MKFSKIAIVELKSFFNEITNSENVKALKTKDPFNLFALRKSYRTDEVFEFGLKTFLSHLPNKYRLLNLSPNKRNFDVAMFCVYIGYPRYFQRAYEILKNNTTTLQQFETLGVPSIWFTEQEEAQEPKAEYTHKKVNAPDPSLYFEKRDNEETKHYKTPINAALCAIIFITTCYIAYKNPKVFTSLGGYIKDGLNSKLANFSATSHFNRIFDEVQLH